MIQWDGLGVALFYGVVAPPHRQVPQQEEEKQRRTLVSHSCFPSELADMDFFQFQQQDFFSPVDHISAVIQPAKSTVLYVLSYL